MYGPEFPDIVNHIWAWFNELHGSRQQGGVGMGPLSFSDMYAWSVLMDSHPSPWEIKLLKKLDKKFLKVSSEKV